MKDPLQEYVSRLISYYFVSHQRRVYDNSEANLRIICI